MYMHFQLKLYHLCTKKRTVIVESRLNVGLRELNRKDCTYSKCDMPRLVTDIDFANRVSYLCTVLYTLTANSFA